MYSLIQKKTTTILTKKILIKIKVVEALMTKTTATTRNKKRKLWNRTKLLVRKEKGLRTTKKRTRWMLKSSLSLKLRILMMNQMRIYPKTNKSSITTLKCWSAGLAISIFSTILKKSTANARGSVKLRLMKADKSLILKKTILRMNWMKN